VSPAPEPQPVPSAAASDAVLARLNALHPKIIDLSLGRIERLLAPLGNPERRLPPVVHLAGTNGKGSVLAYLRAMLEAEGRRVHAYTSPHLVRFHERIRLAGRLIEEPALLALLEECEAANGAEPITFFEITTAAAFLAFARQPADALLLEVGLGGRLDATNLVERPALSVITPVSMDHMQYLGDSLEAIAFEKAGILKPGVPAVVGLQPEAALAVILERAAEIGAPVAVQGRDFHALPAPGGFRFLDGGLDLSLPAPVLAGAHQRDNAALALAAAARLGALAPAEPARRAGLAAAQWPARLQRLQRGPLPALLPGGWSLWLDGGHNAAAGAALAAWLAERPQPLRLVYGMLNSKAAEAFLRPLAPFAESLQAVAIPGEPNSLSAEAAAAHARACGIAARPRASLAEAVAAAVEGAGPEGRVLICGSLYLAGRVLAENG